VDLQQSTHVEEDQPSPDFLDSFYEGSCFSGLSCRELELRDVEFFQCRFVGCAFFQSIFQQCHFEQCVFDKCDLSMMKATGSRLIDVRFLKSKMLGIDWTLVAIPMTVAFQESNISHSSFQRLSLQKMELTECVAHEVDFMGANLTKATFAQTDFLGSRFVNTNLSGANFSRATNYAIDPTANRLKKAIFSLPEAMSLLSAFDIVLK
jgi:uncharacterized protein YjbI with pentapeptide repeats